MPPLFPCSAFMRGMSKIMVPDLAGLLPTGQTPRKIKERDSSLRQNDSFFKVLTIESMQVISRGINNACLYLWTSPLASDIFYLYARIDKIKGGMS
jgi:hypothetical protein